MLMPVILFGKEIIPYELFWSEKRKTLGISVQGNIVQVTAPNGVSEENVINILNKKAPWIRKQLEEYKEINSFTEEKKFIAGEKLPYLGRAYRLKIIKEDYVQESGFKFYQGMFVGTVSTSLQEDQYRQELYPLYKKWVISRADTFIQDRRKRFSIKIGESPTKIQVKEQKKRWGSCTPDGKILFNWRIFLAPTSVVDYVLIHELTHLIHMNHSYDFWNTIKMVLPDYEIKKEWLRINGRKLYI